jgi:hypothetical protein
MLALESFRDIADPASLAVMDAAKKSKENIKQQKAVDMANRRANEPREKKISHLTIAQMCELLRANGVKASKKLGQKELRKLLQDRKDIPIDVLIPLGDGVAIHVTDTSTAAAKRNDPSASASTSMSASVRN